MNGKLFIQLVLAFIAFTILGTLSHELGHFLVGEWLGYEMSMNYATTFVQNDSDLNSIDSFLVTLGGPIQTILTGTIGCVLLFLNRKNFQSANKLSLKQWILVFVSLFWLRQLTNLVTWIAGYLINGEFNQGGDELRIAYYLGLPDWSILMLTALIGALVLALVVFNFVPSKQRLTFIFSGLTGGIAGYLFWLVFLGKYILP